MTRLFRSAAACVWAVLGSSNLALAEMVTANLSQPRDDAKAENNGSVIYFHCEISGGGFLPFFIEAAIDSSNDLNRTFNIGGDYICGSDRQALPFGGSYTGYPFPIYVTCPSDSPVVGCRFFVQWQ